MATRRGASARAFHAERGTRNDKAQALDYYQTALTLLQQVGDRWHQADVTLSRSSVYIDLGDLPQAKTQLQAAVALAAAVQHPNLARFQAKLAEVQASRRQGAGEQG